MAKTVITVTDSASSETTLVSAATVQKVTPNGTGARVTFTNGQYINVTETVAQVQAAFDA